MADNPTRRVAPPAERRLLIVALHNSPHTHRWISMIARPDTAIVLFPSLALEFSAPDGFVPISPRDLAPTMPPGLWIVRADEVWNGDDRQADERAGYVPLSHTFLPAKWLASPQTLIDCVSRLRPHLLHAMEMQLAGYLCAEAARRMPGRFPPWIMSNWGSDIALFRKLPGHAERIAAVCRSASLFLADCHRDNRLARDFGYGGPLVPAMPSSGGMDIAALAQHATTPPAKRRLILLKGNHNWAGRGLLALSAVALAKGRLGGCRIGIVAPARVHAEWAAHMTGGLDFELYDHTPDHQAAVARMAEARAVIGIGISDGCPTTMLEGMALGALPIQSSTACVDEWVVDGVNGLIVSAHDTAAMAEALVRAATDDELVERAAPLNRAAVAARWDVARNRLRAWEIYDGLMGVVPARGASALG